jgi:hypothetical protein
MTELARTEFLPTQALSINQLILLAYKQAALVPLEATLSSANMVPKLEFGRQHLDLLLPTLHLEGHLVQTQILHTELVEAGVAELKLPGHILDVSGSAMWVQTPAGVEDPVETTTTGLELYVSQVDIETWHVQTNKEQQSPYPLMYAAQRDGGQCRVRLWPATSERGLLRFKAVRLFARAADGKGPPDLHIYWQDWLVHALAASLAQASGMPRADVMMLLQMAEAKKAACTRYGKEHPPQRAVITWRP